MSRVSNCCGSAGTKLYPGESDVTYKDMDICQQCGEPCEYVKDEPDDNDLVRMQGMTSGERQEYFMRLKEETK